MYKSPSQPGAVGSILLLSPEREERKSHRSAQLVGGCSCSAPAEESYQTIYLISVIKTLFLHRYCYLYSLREAACILLTLVMTASVLTPKERLLHQSEILSMGLGQIQNIHTGYDQLEVPQPIYGVLVRPEGGNHKGNSVSLRRSYELSDGGIK